MNRNFIVVEHHGMLTQIKRFDAFVVWKTTKLPVLFTKLYFKIRNNDNDNFCYAYKDDESIEKFCPSKNDEDEK